MRTGWAPAGAPNVSKVPESGATTVTSAATAIRCSPDAGLASRRAEAAECLGTLQLRIERLAGTELLGRAILKSP
jgi:hypothetical protein